MTADKTVLFSLSMILLLPMSVSANTFTATASRAAIGEDVLGNQILYLTDSVEVTDGEITVTSDVATVWQLSERAVFIGNVQFESDTISGTSDYLEYDKASGVITMTGNVVLFDGESEVRAGEVIYYKDSKKATAKDSVVMTGEWQGTVSGEYAMYDYGRNSIFITVYLAALTSIDWR
ncbi:MAG: hypothetical protein H8D05_00050, partial [FCB group bacterium]|nr:hypothetical protein [FCB group bacterium]